jgi:hypothetical protein
MQLYLPVRSTDCAEAPVAANAATRPTVKDSILMKITPLLHVVELTRNRGRRPLVWIEAGKPRSSKNRHGRACPAIHVFLSNGNEERGCPGAVYAKATTGSVLVSPKP